MSVQAEALGFLVDAIDATHAALEEGPEALRICSLVELTPELLAAIPQQFGWVIGSVISGLAIGLGKTPREVWREIVRPGIVEEIDRLSAEAQT